MATMNFGDLRKGLAIEIDGQPYEVVDYTATRCSSAPR